jgi:chemotaxis protein MotB
MTFKNMLSDSGHVYLCKMTGMKNILFALLAILFTGGCVPSKKYEEMQAQYYNQVQKNFEQEALINSLQDEYTFCRDKYQQSEMELAAARQHIDSLSQVITGLRNEITIWKNELEATRHATEASLGDAQAAIQATRAELLQKQLELERKEQELAKKEMEIDQLAKRTKELEDLFMSQKKAIEQLRDNIRQALTGFNDSELTVSIRDGKVYVSMTDKLLFKSGSTVVEPRGVEALGKVADVIKKNTDIQVTVEGHTDNVPLKGTGQMKDNWDLSVLRATSVIKILTDRYAVPVKRVTASGRGEYFPVGDNTTADGRAKNRRTEIILMPDLAKLMKILEN